MSSRYEREIEEILRRTEDGRPSVSERIRAFNQRPPSQRPPRRGFQYSTETALLVGVILAFIAATLRWYFQYQNALLSLIIGLIGLAAFIIIVVTLIMAWASGNSGPTKYWRGRPVNNPQSPRRGPFSQFMVNLNLLRLRQGYRNRQR